MTGLVRRYNAARGFGFIQPLIGKPTQTKDVFFHRANVHSGGNLPVGAEVEFDVCRGSDGQPQAMNVRVKLLSAACLRVDGSGRRGPAKEKLTCILISRQR